MTDHRANGALDKFTGKFQDGFGAFTGDAKSRFEGQFKQVSGTAKDYYGRAIQGLDGQIERVPANLQPQARKAVDFARERPLVTVAGLAALALILTRGGRR